jgi:hypothetical protein
MAGWALSPLSATCSVLVIGLLRSLRPHEGLGPTDDVELGGGVELASRLLDRPPRGRVVQPGQQVTRGDEPGEQGDRQVLTGPIVGVVGKGGEGGGGRQGPEQPHERRDLRRVEHPADHHEQGPVRGRELESPRLRRDRGGQLDRRGVPQDLVDLGACAPQVLQGSAEPVVEAAQRLAGTLVALAQLGDLREREPEPREPGDPQDPHQVRDPVLLVAVGAPARLREQADRVVVPHRPHGRPAEVGDLPRAPCHRNDLRTRPAPRLASAPWGSRR